MKFEILTIFPDFFRGPLDYGIVRRAREAGSLKSAFTICGRLRTTAIARWTTGRSAAAKAWCSSRSPSSSAWSRWVFAA